jgi:hypothetical protein
MGVAVAADQSLYISEWGNDDDGRIRRVDANGTINTFSNKGGSRIRFNEAGNLFTVSWRIQPNGYTTLISGGSVPDRGNIGDGGPASQTPCNGGGQYDGLAFDAEGDLLCSNNDLLRIRAIRFGAVLAEPGSFVTVNGGSNQSAPVYAKFAQDLSVTLRASDGTLQNGIRIDFAAPVSGPSCTFPSGTRAFSVLTDPSGRATVACRANSEIGSFLVTATPLGLSSQAQFALTNTEGRPRRRAVRH